VINEQDDPLYVFDYLLGWKQRRHVSHQWLKLDINRTVLLVLLPVFDYLTYTHAVYYLKSKSCGQWTSRVAYIQLSA
jgi:hypothetical protein